MPPGHKTTMRQLPEGETQLPGFLFQKTFFNLGFILFESSAAHKNIMQATFKKEEDTNSKNILKLITIMFI